MNGEMTLNVIARIHSPFSGKFGIPRQSGRVAQVLSRIVFESEYRCSEALRGLEDFSHLWIIWQFSMSVDSGWSPTVRPPRLGGNRRMGVFATRSPYRPNALGLSCVKISRIVLDSPEGPYIEVLGADLLDGTPIYDIKPYLPSSDCIPDAVGGFAESVNNHKLSVSDPRNCLSLLSSEQRDLICALLAEDPRPGYQKDPQRVYTFECADIRVSFRVEDDQAVICQLIPL